MMYITDMAFKSLIEQKHKHIRIRNKVIHIFISWVEYLLVLNISLWSSILSSTLEPPVPSYISHTWVTVLFSSSEGLGYGIVSPGRGPHDYKPQYYFPLGKGLYYGYHINISKKWIIIRVIATHSFLSFKNSSYHIIIFRKYFISNIFTKLLLIDNFTDSLTANQWTNSSRRIAYTQT